MISSTGFVAGESRSSGRSAAVRRQALARANSVARRSSTGRTAMDEVNGVGGGNTDIAEGTATPSPPTTSNSRGNKHHVSSGIQRGAVADDRLSPDKARAAVTKNDKCHDAQSWAKRRSEAIARANAIKEARENNPWMNEQGRGHDRQRTTGIETDHVRKSRSVVSPTVADRRDRRRRRVRTPASRTDDANKGNSAEGRRRSSGDESFANSDRGSGDAPLTSRRKQSMGQAARPGRKARQQPLVTVSSPASTVTAGSSKKDEGTRQMFDKRRLRRNDRIPFMSAITKWREVNASKPVTPSQQGDCSEGESNSRPADASDKVIGIFVRKRPLFEHEEQRKEFDVVTIPSPGEAIGVTKCAVVHNCLHKPNLKDMEIRHITYPVTHAFDDTCSNEQVYEVCLRPRVAIAAAGGHATLFMFGQTGSGKSYTMTALEDRMCDDIFKESATYMLGEETSPSHSVPSRTPSNIVVAVSFFEVAGKRCTDLLADPSSSSGNEVTLRETVSGVITFQGASQKVVQDAAALRDVLLTGHRRRATEATRVNAGSSRSHGICRISIRRCKGDAVKENEAISSGNHDEGRLTLVDCAGSERKEDSMYHNAERQKESAEINASIFALKECIRFRALRIAAASSVAETTSPDASSIAEQPNSSAPPPSTRIPFRDSTLTRVLMESFVHTKSNLAVIATISPGCSDTEHSIETLKAVAKVSGIEARVDTAREEVLRVNEIKIVSPKAWSAIQLQAWLRDNHPSMTPTDLDAFAAVDGRSFLKLNQRKVTAMCGGDTSLGTKIFNTFRNELDERNREITRLRIQLKNGAI